MKKERTQIMLDKKMKEALYKYAKENDVSMGRVVRDAMDQYLAAKKTTLKKPKSVSNSLLKSYKKIKFDGGKDLSKEVDKIVYGI